MKIKNKRIIITGGTSGIGYEMTKQLHSHNDVIVIARSEEKLERLLQKFIEIITFQILWI